MTGTLIHIYRAPPQVGDTALCGYVREDEMEGHRLHTAPNQCLVCHDIADHEGIVLMERAPTDPEDYWRLSE